MANAIRCLMFLYTVFDLVTGGACWSFSATRAVEAIDKLPLDLLLASRNKTTGLILRKNIPIEHRMGPAIRKRHVVTIDKYVDVPQNNEKQLLQAVAAQPVSVGICGSERAFQMYSKGIFTGACSTTLDHAVLIVGYGSENGVDPWSRSFFYISTLYTITELPKRYEAHVACDKKQ
ncbi:cysteine proteinase COT44-like [Populus alba]|uniref:cysteine proteinase COT44-like n=1 Tax=Populus alba TaxID=43335 RepID=UPI003CC785EF